jgi:hypothetical protein
MKPGYSDESVPAQSPNSEQLFSQGGIAENDRLFDLTEAAGNRVLLGSPPDRLVSAQRDKSVGREAYEISRNQPREG